MQEPPDLFQLTADQFRSVLEAVTGEPVAHFRISPEAAPTAVNKTPVTVSFSTRAGTSGECRLFVKRCVWKGRPESVHYRFLAERGVPTPTLYAALTDDKGEEIIFLEQLASTGFREDNEEEWRSMLSLSARLNACALSLEYEPHLHPYEMIGTIDGALWIMGLHAEPTRDEIDAELNAGGIGPENLPRIRQSVQNAMARIAAQPRGLLHQDFLPDNLGRRGEREEMVVFDLHKNACGPRFADVAPYLALPDWSRRAEFLDKTGPSGETRRYALTRHYLSEYARFGGARMSVRDFEDEASLLSWAHKLSSLSWLSERGRLDRIQEVIQFLSRLPD